MKLTRRQALSSAAILPLAAAATPAFAAGHAEVSPLPTHRAHNLGDFKVVTLLAGSRAVPDPHSIFGLNVPDEEFNAVSEAAFLPSDNSQFFFTPTLVDTGEAKILFDTGLNPGGITAALAAAGYAPGDIDTVVITHMHGDHIGGLSGDAGETFAGANYVSGQVEYDHWAGAGNDNFEGKVRPLAEKFSFLGDGGSVASGITAVAAHGHTPGHMAYMLDSGGKQMLLIADTANHAVWSLERPDWEVKFDMDKAAAAATRRKLFDMVAAERMPLVGYHLPFPAVGYVETAGEGFHYVPASYQLML